MEEMEGMEGMEEEDKVNIEAKTVQKTEKNRNSCLQPELNGGIWWPCWDQWVWGSSMV